MAMKFKGSIEQLKVVVEMTGASGEWLDKGRGYWQFRGNDSAILNWWASSGTITFQGPQEAKQEFEVIVDLAISKFLSQQVMGEAAGGSPRELPAIPMVKLGRYRHYRGKEYEVIGIARHSETMEEMVVYRALYGEHGLWVRPRGMFVEEVEVEGRKVPRFEFIG
jgi:hypothetical protein